MYCILYGVYYDTIHSTVKDESLGLVSVSRLKVPRLSVSSRSRTKFWNLSRLGLVSDENFWDSLVPVSSRWFNFYLVSSRSRLGHKKIRQSRLGLVSFKKSASIFSRSR